MHCEECRRPSREQGERIRRGERDVSRRFFLEVLLPDDKGVFLRPGVRDWAYSFCLYIYFPALDGALG